MYDDDLENLDESLRRLKVEYHIYFTGNRKKPPDDIKMRVERLIKKLSECSDLSVTQRFRFNTLITRFYVYRDLWRRTLVEREMGAEPKAEAVAGRSLPYPPPGFPWKQLGFLYPIPRARKRKYGNSMTHYSVSKKPTDKSHPFPTNNS